MHRQGKVGRFGHGLGHKILTHHLFAGGHAFVVLGIHALFLLKNWLAQGRRIIDKLGSGLLLCIISACLEPVTVHQSTARMNDYYANLGLGSDATLADIKKAFRQKASFYHPDRNHAPEAPARFRAVQEAYEVLSDTAKRKEYDSLRGPQASNGDSYFNEESDDAPPSYDPLDREWRIATKYYPDLPEIEEGLSKIAWRLSYTYGETTAG